MANLLHKTQSNVVDAGVAGEIGPSEWNEGHKLLETGLIQSDGADPTTFTGIAASSIFQYLRRKNAVASTSYEFASLPFFISGDFYFTGVTVSGVSLTGTIGNTITLPYGILGISGSFLNHYIRILDAVAGNEVVLITGGTATSGVAGTLQFTPALSHSAGNWSLESATAGIQEAVNHAINSMSYRSILISPGSHTLYATISLNNSSNISVWAVPGTVKLNLNRSSGTIRCIENLSGVLTLGTTLSSNAITFANRAVGPLVEAITVTTISGYTAGDSLLLTYNDGTFIYNQINKIRSIVSSTINLEYPLLIPLITGQSNAVQKIVMASNVNISGIIFDGTSATGGTYSAIYLQGCQNSVVRDVEVNNFNSAGLVTFYGYRNNYDNIVGDTTGDTTASSHYFQKETESSFSNMKGRKVSFGFEPVSCTACIFNNINTSSPIVTGGRAIKFNSCAWCLGSNFIANNGRATGFSIMAGSFRNIFSNVQANWCRVFSGGNGYGIYFSSTEQNIYNVVNGFMALGNETHDVVCNTNDINNAILNGIFDTSSVSSSNWLSSARQPRVSVSNAVAQTIPNITDTDVTFDTENHDPLLMHDLVSNTHRLTVPTGQDGFYHFECIFEFVANATGIRRLILFKNGSAVNPKDLRAAISGQTITLMLSGDLYLVGGDFIHFKAYQDSGGNLNSTASGTTMASLSKIG